MVTCHRCDPLDGGAKGRCQSLSFVSSKVTGIVAEAVVDVGPEGRAVGHERFQSRATARVIVGCVMETGTSPVGIQSDPPSSEERPW
jgi:hypothetical protein